MEEPPEAKKKLNQVGVGGEQPSVGRSLHGARAGLSVLPRRRRLFCQANVAEFLVTGGAVLGGDCERG
jgi:hypothetical protein